MSEAIIFEEMPYNLFLKQRLEFVVICQDHLAASIMRVIEKEMIKRKEAWQARVEKAMEEKKTPPQEPKSYWVHLSQAQIIARLYMYDSAKLKKPEDPESEEYKEYLVKKALSISKATIVKAINLLISKGFLLMKSKQGDEFSAPMYTLHKQHIQTALKTLPKNPFSIFHQGGVENFESGGESEILRVPPENFESGESHNSRVPVSENESPQSKNFRVFIDITNRDSLSEIEENEEESIPPNSESTSTSGAFAPSPADVSLSENTPAEEIPVTYDECIDYLAAHGGTPPELDAVQTMQAARTRYVEQKHAEPPPVPAMSGESAYEHGIQVRRQIGRDGITRVTFDDLVKKQQERSEAEQQALMAATPRESAKVESPAPPAPNKRRNKGLPQLTLQGQHMLDLFDASKPIKRKTVLTADNIDRANRLAAIECDDDDFTRAVQRMRDDPFLKAKKVAIDLDFVDRKLEKFLTIVDQEREAAEQAEKAKREAEERAKTQSAQPPRKIAPTALEQHMREMEARYMHQGGN